MHPKVQHAIQRTCRTFGFELRRVRHRVVPEAVPMIVYWLQRLEYFRRMMERVAPLPGDIVECGVGGGRSLFMLAYWLQQPAHQSRQLFGLDSFHGFPEPTAEDASRRRPQKGEWGDTSPGRVLDFLETSGIPREFLNRRVHLVPGFFSETFTTWMPRPIALLHLDVDLYESYQETLTALFPQVVPGGVVLFDEYADPLWPGAKPAIDQFFSGTPYQVQEEPLVGKYYLVKTAPEAALVRRDTGQ